MVYYLNHVRCRDVFLARIIPDYFDIYVEKQGLSDDFPYSVRVINILELQCRPGTIACSVFLLNNMGTNSKFYEKFRIKNCTGPAMLSYRNNEMAYYNDTNLRRIWNGPDHMQLLRFTYTERFFYCEVAL